MGDDRAVERAGFGFRRRKSPSPDSHSQKGMVSLSRYFESEVPARVGCSARDSGWRAATRAVLAAVFLLGCALGPARAQQEHKHKVPGLDKITGGPNEQAFTGTVQSLDLRHELLNVNTVQGGDTEIFPLRRKGIHVATANGERVRLRELTPGTNILVYYEQRGDRRTVKEIVVLGAAPPKGKKASPPPS